MDTMDEVTVSVVHYIQGFVVDADPLDFEYMEYSESEM